MQNHLKFLIVISVASMLLLQTSNAFAAQPYVAANSQQTAVKNATVVRVESSFTGSSSSGTASYVSAMLSSASFSSTTATDPTVFMYQSFPALQSGTAGNIRGNAEIWKLEQNAQGQIVGVRKFDSDPNTPTIGTLSGTNKILHTIGFNDVAKTQIRFHFDVYSTSGSVTSYDVIASKSSYDSTDPTQYFGVGQMTPATGRVVKLTQWGVEQGGTSNTGWKVTQDQIIYQTSATNIVNLSTKPAYAIKAAVSPTTYNSNINYIRISGSIAAYGTVGDTTENNAGADYNLKTSTIPKGKINWFHTTDSTKKISEGTQLWN